VARASGSRKTATAKRRSAKKVQFPARYSHEYPVHEGHHYMRWSRHTRAWCPRSGVPSPWSSSLVELISVPVRRSQAEESKGEARNAAQHGRGGGAPRRASVHMW